MDLLNLSAASSSVHWKRTLILCLARVRVSASWPKGLGLAILEADLGREL